MATIFLVIRENTFYYKETKDYFCEQPKWVERVPSWDDFIIDF